MFTFLASSIQQVGTAWITVLRILRLCLSEIECWFCEEGTIIAEGHLPGNEDYPYEFAILSQAVLITWNDLRYINSP